MIASTGAAAGAAVGAEAVAPRQWRLDSACEADPLTDIMGYIRESNGIFIYIYIQTYNNYKL